MAKTREIAIGYSELFDYILFRFDGVPNDLEVVSAAIEPHYNAITITLRSDSFPNMDDFTGQTAEGMPKPDLMRHLRIPTVTEEITEASTEGLERFWRKDAETD
tara:strand:+ start:268 stop:579 length:312 start_codon:yes stop_codon:yes gene_type:complete